jgi:nucleoside-diphosphate-sugar epimerase
MQSNYRVFVAGASGTIGMPLVQALVTAGHHVTALTRSPDKQAALRARGATPVVADALDPLALRRAVEAAHPTHVIHQLTALPKGGARRGSDLASTNKLRTDGTRNLLEAALAAGARRFIAGSFGLLDGLKTYSNHYVQEAVAAVHSMESQVLAASDAGAIEGVVLRYGAFYGPQNPATQQMMSLVRRRMLPVVRHDAGLLPCIHIDDAVSATVAALDHGRSGAIYDIVDDMPVSMSELIHALAAAAGAPPPRTVPGWVPRLFSPFMAAFMRVRLTPSNARARAELGWRPAFATYRDGLADTVRRAA